jgi:tetratricopeptide (TPR) repeat protein
MSTDDEVMPFSFSMITEPRVRRGNAAPAMHLPFVEAMTTAVEGTPEWAAIKAGWFVVRFVDKWAQAVGQSGAVPWLREVHAIHEAISGVPVGATRRVLERLYAALVESWGRRDLTVSSTLLAYGHHLERDESWGMAADVFQTFLFHAATDSDHELAPDAYLRLAYTHRRAGRVDEAAAAYDAAGALAASEGNVRAGLLARIGSARVMKHRGNMPAAVSALDAVIVDTTALVALGPSAGLSDALARAKHDRGLVAYEMDQPEVAVTLLYAALELYQDETSRERVLGDVAICLTDLGLHDAARDAHTVLYRTAGEPSMRHTAACNLMYLANESGQELLFQQYRKVLSNIDLSPEILAFYQIVEGEGLARFGDVHEARIVLERAVKTAERFQLNAYVHRAETVLAKLGRAPVVSTQHTTDVEAPAAISHVVTAVRRLREMSEASV